MGAHVPGSFPLFSLQLDSAADTGLVCIFAGTSGVNERSAEAGALTEVCSIYN